MKKGLVLLTIIFMAVITASCGKLGSNELSKEKIAVKFAREVLRGNYKIVTVDELNKWQNEKKEMLIIDTMPKKSSYNKHHIPGAEQILFPIPEMRTIENSKKKNLLALLGKDKKKTIVFYCGFTKCTRSHNAAMWAAKLGYKNVYRCPGGIVGWKEAGYPTSAVK